MKNNNEQQRFPINYTAQYVPERNSVVLSVMGIFAIEIPFHIFKKFYYEMDKRQKEAQSNLLVPDKRIITPGA